jgi:hypothetical protein
MPTETKIGRFPMGKIVITNNASRALTEDGLMRGIERHAGGDWGNVNAADKKLNDAAVENGDRLLSAYTDFRTATKFWIITEADRSVTTILLPEDY